MPDPGVDRYSQADTYTYPNSSVLRNIPDIRDQDQLDIFERRAAAIRALEPGWPWTFDYSHLRAIHHQLFQDVYTWAGMERTVSIARGTSRFANPVHLRNNALRLFRQLKNEDHLQRLDVPTFSKRSAHYVVELNALHPFRDGNGRTVREFLRQLAVQGNHELSPAVHHRERWIEACIHGFNHDATLMERLIAEALAAPVPGQDTGCLSIRTMGMKERGHWRRRISASSLPDDVKADYLAQLR